MDPAGSAKQHFAGGLCLGYSKPSTVLTGFMDNGPGSILFARSRLSAGFQNAVITNKVIAHHARPLNAATNATVAINGHRCEATAVRSDVEPWRSWCRLADPKLIFMFAVPLHANTHKNPAGRHVQSSEAFTRQGGYVSRVAHLGKGTEARFSRCFGKPRGGRLAYARDGDRHSRSLESLSIP